MDGSASKKRRPRLSGGFIAIIAFKFLKAAAFTLIGIGALHIARLPRESQPMVLSRMVGSSESIVVRHVSTAIAALTNGQVKAIGVAAIAIAAVFAAEGTLLILRKPWAPLFTIVLTALGIPAEIVEIFRQPGSVRRYLLLAINAAILYYLWRKKDEFRGKSKPAHSKEPRQPRLTRAAR